MHSAMKDTRAKFTETEAAFLPLVSHDIKSLSIAILCASQSLSTKLNQPGTAEAQEIHALVQLINSAGSNLLPYIEDLVALGKFSADSSSIKPVAVYNLSQEMECARDTFSYEALTRQIDLTLTFLHDIPVVYCDINNLRVHAISNILSNALRHTPAGGKVSVVVCRTDQQTLSIKISDSGTGIPPSERTSLFRRYLKSSKIQGTTNSKRGIGLYNATRSVQAHKGTLSIVDEPGVSGATFHIEIPLFSTCIR